MPLLMNDTIFNKIIKDCRRYPHMAVKNTDKFAQHLIYIHSAMLKQVCFGQLIEMLDLLTQWFYRVDM